MHTIEPTNSTSPFTSECSFSNLIFHLPPNLVHITRCNSFSAASRRARVQLKRQPKRRMKKAHFQLSSSTPANSRELSLSFSRLTCCHYDWKNCTINQIEAADWELEGKVTRKGKKRENHVRTFVFHFCFLFLLPWLRFHMSGLSRELHQRLNGIIYKYKISGNHMNIFLSTEPKMSRHRDVNRELLLLLIFSYVVMTLRVVTVNLRLGFEFVNVTSSSLVVIVGLKLLRFFPSLSKKRFKRCQASHFFAAC